MQNPFEIEIIDDMREVTYKLKGSYLDTTDNFKINHKQCSFCGFGGSIDNPLPEIAVNTIDLLLKMEIIDAINKMVEGEI